MKFGASIWPFQWNPPYDDAIRRLAAAGFQATELIAWNGDFLRDYYTDQTIAGLRDLIAGEGLVMSQFVSTPPGLSSDDPAERTAGVEHWKRAVEVGAALGAPIINMVGSHGFGMADGREYPRIVEKPLVQRYGPDIPRGLDWDGNYAAYVDAIRICAEIAAAAGVRISVEPHPGRYLSNADSALRLLDKVDHPALGINFDPSHTFPLGDFPNVSVYRLNRHLIHCHVSDNDAVTNVHWRPGMGKIDWRAMLVAMQDIGYDDVISIELEDVPGVSRGPRHFAPGMFKNTPATEAFLAENLAGIDYLKSICADLGINVED